MAQSEAAKRWAKSHRAEISRKQKAHRTTAEYLARDKARRAAYRNAENNRNGWNALRWRERKARLAIEIGGTIFVDEQQLRFPYFRVTGLGHRGVEFLVEPLPCRHPICGNTPRCEL